MEGLEAIEHTISALKEHFETRMADFQHQVQTAIPATSPTSNVAAQFGAFRLFVMASLENLQLQVQLLSKQCDLMEMRSRRKMLLVHGVPEVQNENVPATTVKVFSEHMEVPELSVGNISFSKRLGQPKEGKVRAILVKFSDLSTRNKIWFSKTQLKGSGITLSEFLTKERHNAFQAARQKFGVTRCWTRDGFITIVGPDGKRHRVSSVAEVKRIGIKPAVPVPTTAAELTSSGMGQPSATGSRPPVSSAKVASQPPRARRDKK